MLFQPDLYKKHSYLIDKQHVILSISDHFFFPVYLKGIIDLGYIAEYSYYNTGKGRRRSWIETTYLVEKFKKEIS